MSSREMIAREQEILDLEAKLKFLKKSRKTPQPPQEELPTKDSDRYNALGKQYVLTVSLWLHNQKIAFTVKEDPGYRPSRRYRNDMIMQGQLRDLKELVPEELHGHFGDVRFQSKVFIRVTLMTPNY